jgi:hypothetical protein
MAPYAALTTILPSVAAVRLYIFITSGAAYMIFSDHPSPPGHVRLEKGTSQHWGADKKIALTTDNIIDATSSLTLNGGELHLNEGQLTVDGILEVQSGSRLRVRRGKLTGNGQIKISKGGVLELASDTVPSVSELTSYRGGLTVVNHGSIYGQGVIDGDLTVEKGGSITLATQPLVMSSTATQLPPIVTSESADSFSTTQTSNPTPNPTMIVIVGSASSSSGVVNETITPTAYGRLWVTKGFIINGATLNIFLTTHPTTPPFTFPSAGQQFDMIVAGSINLVSNFVPSPPNDNSPDFYFSGARVVNNPFAPGYQAYLLTTHVSTP